jgi:anaerobic selenocysteine-containing dehydrogenase
MKFTRRDFLKTTALIGASLSFLKPNKVNAKNVGNKTITEKVPSICNFCSTSCSILVDVKVNSNGKRRITKIDGNPNSDLNRGRICARGQAGMFQTYDPNRIKTPLIRIEGSKRGEWKFKKASWDEAFKYIADKVKEKDIQPWEWSPVCSWISCVFYKPFSFSFFDANKIPNIIIAPIQHCVTTGHIGVDSVIGNWNIHDEVLVDWENVKYGIFSATNAGIAGMSTSRAVRFKKGLENGSEFVVLDPRHSETASKASKWLPIKPGTDLAFFLGLMNSLIKNKQYDENFITSYSNFPFIALSKDGNVKPLLEKKNVMKDDKVVKQVIRHAFVYDELSKKIVRIKGFANSNLKDINGNKIKPLLELPTNLTVADMPADFIETFKLPEGKKTTDLKLKTFFQIIGKQVESYTPEWAAKESDLNLDSVKEVYHKMGTIKPACIDIGWSGGRFRNMVQTRKTMAAIQTLLGGIDKKGGWIQSAHARHSMHSLLDYKKDVKENGFRSPKSWEKFGIMSWLGNPKVWGSDKRYDHGYPAYNYAMAAQVRKAGGIAPVRPFFTDYGFYDAVEGNLKWKGKPYKIRAMYFNAANYPNNFYPRERALKALEGMDLVISADILPSESALFSDVILPDSSYLERKEAFVFMNGPSLDGAYATRFPAIKPLYDTKSLPDILFGMSEAMGTIGVHVKKFAGMTKLDPEIFANKINEFKEKGSNTPYLDACFAMDFNRKAKKAKMTPEELKIKFYDKGVVFLEDQAHLLEHENMPRKIPMGTPSGRVEPWPFSFAKVSNEVGGNISWSPNFKYYGPSFNKEDDKKAAPKFNIKDDEFFFIFGKIALVGHAGTSSANPILAALIKQDVKSFKRVWINTNRATKLGLKTGDKIEITTVGKGYKEVAEVDVTELIREDTIFMNSSLGGFSPELKLSYKNGPGIGKLIPANHDTVTAAYRSQEFTVKVKKIG